MDNKTTRNTKHYRAVKDHQIITDQHPGPGRPRTLCDTRTLETRRANGHLRRRMACLTHQVRFTQRQAYTLDLFRHRR